MRMDELSRLHQRYTIQAGWTDSLRKTWFERHLPPGPARVLDLGCGTGALFKTLLSHHPTARLTGVDIDPAPLHLAQQHVGRLPLDLASADAHQLPFTDRVFDTAICHFLLLWVADPARVLREMRRVTAPGGWVAAFAEPDYGARLDYPDELAELGRLQTLSLRSQGADPCIGRELRALFTYAGLEAVSVGVLGGEWSQAFDEVTFQSEWSTLRADVQERLSPAELDRLEAVDHAAWQRGERVLFVPTFYAWGRVPEP